ncbi:MAG: transglycosylase SLT domain-containing protein, partial [Janthinobacterium lividum]
MRGLLASGLLLLAGCGGSGLTARQSARNYAGSSRHYPPPGPPGDPWGPYIRESSRRFRVPEQWVRAVMHQESGGHAFLGGAPITSSAGAMGLMQVMPATYDELRVQNGLGDDPFDPHNSILAGTAYIRQMYDRYGSPGFLAAYNAGPQRMDNYLAGSGSLPNETVNYVASISPHLGGAMPGGAAAPAYAPVMLATAVPVRQPAWRRRASGCVRDPDAAYDSPCGTIARPPDPQPVQVAAAAPRWTSAAHASPAPAGCVRDPDAAFDSPCGSAPAPVVVAAVRPTPPGCLRDPDAAFDSPCASPRPPPVLVAASEPVASAIYNAAPPAYATRPPPQQVAAASSPAPPTAMPSLVARAEAAPRYAAPPPPPPPPPRAPPPPPPPPR